MGRPESGQKVGGVTQSGIRLPLRDEMFSFRAEGSGEATDCTAGVSLDQRLTERKQACESGTGTRAILL